MSTLIALASYGLRAVGRRLEGVGTRRALNVSGTPQHWVCKPYQPRALCAVAPHLLPGLRGGGRA
eukprot:scaffold129074_cov63-Phaeocystis_antarctica.AAC.3